MWQEMRACDGTPEKVRKEDNVSLSSAGHILMPFMQQKAFFSETSSLRVEGM